MLLTFDEYWPIMEVLGSRFSSITWNVMGGKDVGIGLLGDLIVKLRIDPIEHEGLRGLNLTFGVWDGQSFSEVKGAVSTHSAAKVIGAVTNALKDRVEDYEWGFLTLVAKDDVDARMRLYTRVADRISRERHLDQLSERTKSGHGVTVIGKKELKLREIWDKLAEKLQ